MVKKINRDAESIKKLLSMGYKQTEIVKMLKIKKQKVSYWANKEIIQIQKRRKKLKNVYIERIIKWARNKTTSTMSSRKICTMINSVLNKRNEVDYKKRPISISYRTISNYLKEHYGRPKKIRRAFYLTEDQMKKRVEFCENILYKNIDFKEIMFTDECKVSLSCYTNDWIRLDPDMKKKLKQGEKDAYELINRPSKKFENSIMISGGISYYGLSKLIFIDGTMNNFAYAQTILFFKEDIARINEKNRVNLIFEQDGAPAHKSKSNKYLLNKIFGESGWFQNPPNSPDLAYPIEDLWAILKPRVKRRNPKSIEQLKEFLLEEWNSVPLNLIQNLCKGFIDRVKKVIELQGRKLEPEHLYKNTNEKYEWHTPENLPPFRYVYNDAIIKKYKIKEIKALNAEIKRIGSKYDEKIKKSRETKKKYKARDLKNLSLGRAFSIINGPEQLINEKEVKIKELEKKVEMIENMSLKKYIEFKEGQETEKFQKKAEQQKIDDDEQDIIIENKIKNLERLIESDKKLRFKIEEEETNIGD